MLSESVTTCLVCKNKTTSKDLVIPDHLVSREKFILRMCSNCGLKFISNPPPIEQSGQYYLTEEYIEHSDTSAGLVNWMYHHVRKLMIRFKFRIVDNLNAPKKILDFGTGTGYFLKSMKNKGYETFGIEISEKARKYGREEFGLEIVNPEQINDSTFPSNFGYITFWHVLEHVYDAEQVLKRIHDLLDDNGKLIIALPNYKCLESKVYGKYWNGYDVPRHLWHWNKSGFVRFVEQLGFKLVKTKILPLDPFYNCLISESYRKKIWGYLLIPFIGSISLIQGFFNNDKASSIIYILEKANRE